MGYTTDFFGSFQLDKALAPEHAAYLEAFARTRRMGRKAAISETLPDPVRVAAGLPIGEQGAYYVGGAGDDLGQDRTTDIIDYNRPPSGQPGLWCQWIPSEDGTEIQWDEGEKFYEYVSWLEYVICHFLKPWGYVLNGTVEWQGEERGDAGEIVVKKNIVKVHDLVLRRARR